MKRVFIIFLILLFQNCISQNNVERDTSYTLYSTFLKDVKKFPFIQIPNIKRSTNVLEYNNIVYKNIKTRELHLDVYYTTTKQTNPAVLLIHGGGWKSGDKSQMKSIGLALAAKGFSCFAVEYRLTPEARYPAAVDDCIDAIEFIRVNALQYNVDVSKLVILGCSSGGQLAALIGTSNSTSATNIQAIIDIDGILAFKHPESEEGKAASLWLGGEYESIPEKWKEASALSHVNNTTPPILFINSEMPRFHAGRNDMITILNQYGIYNEVKIIPNAPHSFWFYNPWFELTIDYSVQFLERIFK